MTDRWLNYVLAVIVTLGLAGVAVYERPRAAEERAEFLDQEVRQLQDAPAPPTRRDPLELRRAAPSEEEDQGPLLGDYGVSAGEPDAVEAAMEVLDAGGNAVDAAIAAAYTLGVAEPFGSGPGGGGAMVVYPADGEPRSYDYRETAPLSGELPASNIGVPGFVAGMDQAHEDFGSIEMADLIEPAARLAEDGIEVSQYLHDRLLGAAWRLPIHLAPRFFPNGQAISPGETLRQPEYAQALRTIQEQGPEAMYSGELAEQIVDAVNGLEMEDFEAYEVQELTPAIGSFADYEVVGGGVPSSGPTVVQILQLAEELGVLEQDLESADAYHTIAQAWRLALADRTAHLGDTDFVDVPLDTLMSDDYTAELAAQVPEDGFAEVDEEEGTIHLETDTTHIVVVDEDGTMVSMTNTLSNFFGSGLPVSGFFLNDQLKNFSAEPDSVNRAEPGKRPRSFVAPMILAEDGRPVMGIGSPGGRRIPTMIAEVVIRWAGHDQDLETATEAPRFHLEGRRLEIEESLPGDVTDDLVSRGYQVTTDVPTTEYFGGIQALRVDYEAGRIEGIADDRRTGAWDAQSR